MGYARARLANTSRQMRMLRWQARIALANLMDSFRRIGTDSVLTQLQSPQKAGSGVQTNNSRDRVAKNKPFS